MIHSSLFAHLPDGAEFGQCFPGGHSSGGFAQVASYYVLKQYHRPYAKFGLLFGIGLGAIFGLAQELRGAHFISHDLWSLAIAWTMASLLYYGFFFYVSKVKRISVVNKVSIINANVCDKAIY